MTKQTEVLNYCGLSKISGYAKFEIYFPNKYMCLFKNLELYGEKKRPFSPKSPIANENIGKAKQLSLRDNPFSSAERAIRDLTEPNEPLIKLDKLCILVFVKGKKKH